MTLGDIIKRYREENNLTMEYVANRCGITKGYVAMLEKNVNPKTGKALKPSIETIVKISKGLNISIDSIFEDLDDDTWVTLNKKPIKQIYNQVGSSLDGLTNIILPAAYPLPILGEICAGNGIFCEENYKGMFYVDKSIKADFCLEIKGDSMKDAEIHDGDIVFIKRNYDFVPGKIYAVRIEEDCEAVIKRVYFEGETVVLNPCNIEYQPIVKKADQVTVLGECVGTYHAV